MTSADRPPYMSPASGMSVTATVPQFCEACEEFIGNSAPWNQESTMAPPTRSSKCRCGPLALPVSPTVPSWVPACTTWPRVTSTESRCA